MRTEPERGAGAHFTRFCVWVLVAVAALGALGYLPTRELAGGEAVDAMLAALVAVAVGSIVGGVPILIVQLSGRSKPTVALVAMAVRLLAVALVAAFLALVLELAVGPFLVWLALAYLALLVVDTRYAMTALGGS